MTAATYTELLRRAGAALGEGESVVLDASWTDGHVREEAAQAAEAVAAELVELRCAAPPEVAAARLRSRAPTDPSDATRRWQGALLRPPTPGPQPRPSTPLVLPKQSDTDTRIPGEIWND
jgi:hypothetical protein